VHNSFRSQSISKSVLIIVEVGKTWLIFLKDYDSLVGGCQPLITQSERAATMTGLFIRNAAIVVRPSQEEVLSPFA
jgi:hypothetical protein